MFYFTIECLLSETPSHRCITCKNEKKIFLRLLCGVQVVQRSLIMADFLMPEAQ